MPSRVVRQPDGKFAIFSSVVDNFTYTDMTEDECLAETMVYFDMTEGKAREKMRGGIEDWPPWTHGTPSKTGIERFKDAMSSVALQHGREGIEELRQYFEFNLDEYIDDSWFERDEE